MKALFLLCALLSPAAHAGTVHFLELTGTINPGSAAYILDNIAAAEREGADALVLRLDTPGGLLVSTRSIIQGISQSAVPVLVWVSPGGASATSAGALIALSAHVAAMSPGTNIGAAHPVGSQGEDVKGTMGEKVTNDTAALARAQATLRGRNPQTAEAIVTKSRSYSPGEAVREGAVDFVAEDLPALLARAQGRKVLVEKPRREITLRLDGAAASVVRREMTAQQRFLHFIADPNVSTILITLGGLALWAEVSAGFTSIAAGVVGVFCLVLGFVSLQTLPVNVGGVVLLGLGLALLVAEIYVTSYGLLSLAALASLFLGGLFLIDPAAGSMRVSLSLLLSIVGGAGTVLLITGYTLARDRHRTLSTRDPVAGADARVATVQADGLAGTAYVHGELWSFDAPLPVAVNETHKVHALKGMRIQLEKGEREMELLQLLPGGSIFLVILLVFLFNSIKILNEYERGVIFRLGRAVAEPKGPGLIFVIPVIDRIVRVDLRTVTFDVPPQDVISRDNVTLKVNAVIYFRVTDPLKSVIAIENYLYATSQLAQTTLRSVLGQVDLDELLSSRETLNQKLQGILDQQTEPWGIKVTHVEVKQIDLPPEMQRAMARQAEAERERRAKIIAAEGEFQAAKQLAEAAVEMSRNSTTLSLRYLQTLKEVSGQQGTHTIVFPFPTDLMKFFEQIAGK